MTRERDTDTDLIAGATEELQRCEAPIEVVLRPASAFQLAALLQLALRHPGADGSTALAGRTFIEHVRAYFAQHDASAVVEMLRRGDDPREDR